MTKIRWKTRVLKVHGAQQRRKTNHWATQMARHSDQRPKLVKEKHSWSNCISWNKSLPGGFLSMLIDRENLYSSSKSRQSHFLRTGSSYSTPKSRQSIWVPLSSKFQSHFLRSSKSIQYSPSPTFFENSRGRPIHTFFLLEGSKLSQYHHHHHHHRNNYGQLGQVPACWCLVGTGSFVSHFDSITATMAKYWCTYRYAPRYNGQVPGTDVPTQVPRYAMVAGGWWLVAGSW